MTTLIGDGSDHFAGKEIIRARLWKREHSYQVRIDVFADGTDTILVPILQRVLDRQKNAATTSAKLVWFGQYFEVSATWDWNSEDTLKPGQTFDIEIEYSITERAYASAEG